MMIPKQLTRDQLETVRRVMVKRIAKNLTAEKLSFLMGRRSDYVTNIELFNADPYTTDDIKRIAIAMQDRDLKSFYAGISDLTRIKVIMETREYGSQILYACSILSADHTKQLYFTLQEEMPAAVRLIENNAYDGPIALDAIELLMRAGYFFKCRMPAAIYHKVNRFLNVTLSPTYIQEALNNFCEGDREGALKRMEIAGKGIFYTEA
jgi:hypothetical protein